MRKRVRLVTQPDLEAVREEIFSRLGRAVKDRRSPLHTPVIATHGIDGHMKARIVVLRAFDPVAATLRFHTDRRGRKIAELNADPHISFAFYDPHARVQIRAEGRASIHIEDELADQAWASSQRMSRVCYGVQPGPGSHISGPDDFVLPDDDLSIAAGRAHFCVILSQMDALEYLFLRHAGHRRARFTRAADGWSGEWLAP